MTKTNIHPLPGYVLIEPIEEELKDGAVYLPETSKDKPMKGKVISIGYTKYDPKENETDIHPTISLTELSQMSIPVVEGDIVIYKKWVNQEVKHEGKEYLLVKFDELLAVIK